MLFLSCRIVSIRLSYLLKGVLKLKLYYIFSILPNVLRILQSNCTVPISYKKYIIAKEILNALLTTKFKEWAEREVKKRSCIYLNNFSFQFIIYALHISTIVICLSRKSEMLIFINFK